MPPRRPLPRERLDRRRADVWRWRNADLERKPSRMPGAGPAGEREDAERILIALPVLTPGLFERIADRLVEIRFRDPRHDRAQQCLADMHARDENLDMAAIRDHFERNGLSGLLDDLGRRLAGSAACRAASLAQAELLWNHAFDLYQCLHVLNDEVRADAFALATSQSDEAWQRLRAKWQDREVWRAEVTSLDDQATEDGIGAA